MTYKIETVAVFGASRLGNDPAFAKEMFEIGRLLALEGKTVCVGGLTGLTEQAVLGVLSAGGAVKVFLIPGQQASSLENCRKLGIEHTPVDRDNTRTLELLRCDAWVSGPGGAGTIAESARGIGWNYDRRIRDCDRIITPHFILDMGATNKRLVEAYMGAVSDGLAEPSVLKNFEMVCDAEALIIRMGKFEEAQNLPENPPTSPHPRPAGQPASRPAPRA